LHPPPGVPGDVASAASVDVNEAGAGVIMLPVTHVNEHFVRSGFGESFELFDGAGQCVPIVRITMLRLRSDYPAAFARRGDRDFAAELVTLMRFPFTDALLLRSMHAVNLVLAVPLLHEQLPTGNQKFLQFLT